MEKTDKKYQNFIKILTKELVPAMGCTEPISIAYASSKARSYMKELPTDVIIEVSGNILKNVKSVIVPNTGGMRGIKASAVAGVLFGDSSKELEVISSCSDKNASAINSFIENNNIEIHSSLSPYIFDINIILKNKNEEAQVRIIDNHTNIILIKYNNEIIFKKELTNSNEEHKPDIDYSFITMESIFDFVNSLDINDVKELLERQIAYNMAIAEEGLKNNYGANIGKVILRSNENSTKTRAKAYAAAASDARMNGCCMPVVINSGSGNQGITSSVPVVVYANDLKVNDETKLRALTLSNLVTIHLKSGIGALSAYCGAISAGCGCGCGIAYLFEPSLNVVCHTLVNSLAILSGSICDGAKASCAAKIAEAVDAGILGYEMYQNGNEFKDGDGLTKKGVENTIVNICRLASEGMVETDKKIIDLMINSK